MSEATMDKLDIRLIDHNSVEYHAEVELRHSILRRPLGLQFSTEELAGESTSLHIGCYFEGKLIGCLVLRPKSAAQIQMRQVAVKDEIQGRGVGKRMVEYSEALAKTLGFVEMVLHARETAVPFYEALAYTKVGDRFTEVTIPHWSMVKVLV
jgi:N-acetylglutamate synthase-like GNAT family acetyltransferase